MIEFYGDRKKMETAEIKITAAMERVLGRRLKWAEKPVMIKRKPWNNRRFRK